MHGDVTLAGPLWWLAEAFFIGAVLLAVFIAVDSLRPVRAVRFEQLPEPRWLWTAVAGLYALGAALAQFVRFSPLAIFESLGAPVIIVLGLVYLLRVVFPKPPAPAE